MNDVSPGGSMGAIQAPPAVQFNSFKASLDKFGQSMLTKSAMLLDYFLVTFNSAGGASVGASKLLSSDGETYLCLEPRQMERSGWFALDLPMPTASLVPGSVVVVATDSSCPQGLSSFAVIRLHGQGGEILENASMEVNINASRATRTYPIDISEKFLRGVKNLKTARVILFLEARSATINVFDIQIQCFNLRGAPVRKPPDAVEPAEPIAPAAASPVTIGAQAVEASPVSSLEGAPANVERQAAEVPPAIPSVEDGGDAIVAKAAEQPSPQPPSEGGQKIWSLEPYTRTELIGHSIPIKRGADFEPRLRLAFPETNQQPTVRVTKIGGQYVRHINLTSIARLAWRSLEFHLGDLSNTEKGAFTLRVSSSVPMKIIPILIVMNGEERSDFALFQPIMTTKELTTYSQSAPMEAPRSALTPKSKCRLALILGGVCDDLAIETLAFSAR